MKTYLSTLGKPPENAWKPLLLKVVGFCIFAVLLGFGLSACSQPGPANNSNPDAGQQGFVLPWNAEPKLPSQTYSYTAKLPAYFSQPQTLPNGSRPSILSEDNTPKDNPTTDNGATLGRVLFYDRNLSKNGTIACASCHLQKHGFSDPEPLSKGFKGGRTFRRSMGLTNARFYKRGRFLWGERAETLEAQVIMPFVDQVEMGMTLEEIVFRVKYAPYYATLFRKAFGDSTVTVDRISKALAQFVRSLVSVNSKYDKGRVQVKASLDSFPNFSQQENLGKALFLLPRNLEGVKVDPKLSLKRGAGCAQCHASDAMLTPNSGPTNNGLVTGPELGAFRTFLFDGVYATFKVPSLRNVADRAPYMHDGRFKTLRDVVEHYNQSIEVGPTLGTALQYQDGTAVRFNFSEQEKTALVAFLKTLSDPDFLKDPRFSDPFVKRTEPWAPFKTSLKQEPELQGNIPGQSSPIPFTILVHGEDGKTVVGVQVTLLDESLGKPIPALKPQQTNAEGKVSFLLPREYQQGIAIRVTGESWAPTETYGIVPSFQSGFGRGVGAQKVGVMTKERYQSLYDAAKKPKQTGLLWGYVSSGHIQTAKTAFGCATATINSKEAIVLYSDSSHKPAQANSTSVSTDGSLASSFVVANVEPGPYTLRVKASDGALLGKATLVTKADTVTWVHVITSRPSLTQCP